MSPLLGASVGPYRLEEMVAGDELGVLHRATDERSGGRRLVRLLLPLAQDPAAMHRFRIDLPAIARLDHPNVLRVEEWGEQDGVPYVVTADPPSRRLSDLRAVGRRLDPRLVLRVLRDLAAALDYAHLAGVVHGAVEPGRVLLGSDGVVRLADFGLSPAGAAPEADVQALAAIARDLLAGVPPLAALDPQRHWETCGALVDALEVALGARPAAPAVPAPQWWQRVSLDSLPARLPLWIGLGAGAFLLLLLVAVLVAQALRPAPTLSLSAGSARSGATVVATGGNLPAGQPGTIVLEGRTVGQFRTDEHGAFTYKFVVPVGLAGSRQVQACWGGACPLSRPLVVLADATPGPTATPIPVPVQTLPAATPTPSTRRFTPSISINRRTPRPQDTIQVSGKGFDPAQQYVIVLDEGGRHWVLQTPASPDGRGTFTDPVRIPADARRGLAVISACVSQVDGGQLGACGQQAVLIS